MAKSLILQFELVPRPFWHQEFKDLVGDKTWAKVEAQYKKGFCIACGGKNKLALHESWRYNESTETRELPNGEEDLETLCDKCFLAKHPGQAQMQIKEKKVDYEFDDVVANWMYVNANVEERKKYDELAKSTAVLTRAVLAFGMDRLKFFQMQLEASRVIWEARNEMNWSTDFVGVSKLSGVSVEELQAKSLELQKAFPVEPLSGEVASL